HHTCIAISKDSFPGAHCPNNANRFCCFIVEGNQALFLGLPRWNTQPCGSIGVLIQAINRKPTNLIPSCSAPTSNEQGRSLKRALQSPNSLHESAQLISRNVTGNT